MSTLQIVVEGVLRAAGATAFLAALSLIGLRFCPLRWRPSSSHLLIPFSLSWGASLIGLTTWLVGGLVGVRASFAACLILLLLALSAARSWTAALHRFLCRITPLLRANRLLTAVLGLLVAAPLPQLLIPLIDSDGLRYHAALPKLFLLHDRVFFYRWDFTAAFPQLGEMLFMLVMPAMGGEGAKFIHYGFFVFNVVLVMLLIHRHRRTRSAALLGGILFAASPVVLLPAAAAFVDHASLFHLAVALLLIQRSRRAVAAGLALGGAMATKLTAAPVAVLLIMAVAFRATRGDRLRSSIAALVASACILGPFLVRNALETGDPIFPIGYGIVVKVLPGIQVPEDLLRYFDYTASYNAGVGIPWIHQPGGAPADETVGLHHLLGLFTLLIALLVPRSRLLLALVFPYLAIALLASPPARYYLPMLWALSAFEAMALSRIRSGIVAAAIALLVAAPAIVLSLRAANELADPWTYIRGDLSRSDYLRRVVPGYAAAEWVNSAPRHGSVMALDFPAPYYLEGEWIVEGIQNEPPISAWLRGGASADELLLRLRQMKVVYLIVTPGFGAGKPWSLLPIAATEEGVVRAAALRRELRLVGRLREADIYEVPLPSSPSGRGH